MLAKSKGLKTGVININDSNFYNFWLCSRSLPLEQFLFKNYLTYHTNKRHIMPKNYITILNRLPSKIPTNFIKEEYWNKEKQVIVTEKAVAFLKIIKRNNDWIIGYYIDNIPFTRLLASPNIEDCIEFLLEELEEKQIDIHDILQP